MYKDKLTNDYIKNGFRNHLPEELVPKGFGLVAWKWRLNKWIEKEKQKGYYDDNDFDRLIDRHIEWTAQLIMKEREA